MAQRPKQKILAPAAASANNICLSQTPGGAGALTLNGAAVTAGVATLDMARRVLLTCAGNNSARLFTITGTADGERVISEVLAGTNTLTSCTLKDYKTITSIVIDGASTGAVTVGTASAAAVLPAVNYAASSPWIPITREAWEVGFDVIVTGTINYTVEYTADYMTAPGLAVDTYFNPFAHPVAVNQTGNIINSVDFPIAAIRVTINTYTAGATLTFNVRAATS